MSSSKLLSTSQHLLQHTCSDVHFGYKLAKATSTLARLTWNIMTAHQTEENALAGGGGFSFFSSATFSKSRVRDCGLMGKTFASRRWGEEGFSFPSSEASSAGDSWALSGLAGARAGNGRILRSGSSSWRERDRMGFSGRLGSRGGVASGVVGHQFSTNWVSSTSINACGASALDAMSSSQIKY